MSGLKIGEVIAGKYRVERVLGQGGMATVVLAKHLKLRERVAIKFPLAKLGARVDIAERLVREGRAAMRIRSEHVARVYDVGVLGTGKPYLVMEHLLGRDLGAILAERGPLPIAEAADYILQALEALAEAHARGVIHRDLKPSNLFLTTHGDGSPWIKVIDFGISKIIAGEQESAFTDSAAVFGSPPYMAPEQMRSASAIDARSDIWAVGATLHMLLTGRPPFLAGSIVEIHERIQHGPPALRQVRPDATPELEALLLRCMQQDPVQRYANVAELAAALAPFLPEQGQLSAQRTARIFERASHAVIEQEESPPDASLTEVVPVLEARRTAPPATASWYDGRGPTTETGEIASVVSEPRRDRASRFGAFRSLGLAFALVTLGLAIAHRALRNPERATLGSSQRPSPVRPLTTTADSTRNSSNSATPAASADPPLMAASAAPRRMVALPTAPRLPFQQTRPAAAAPSSTGQPARDPLADPE